MIALTDGQQLILAVLALVFTVIMLPVTLTRHREPPLPSATRRLKRELEKHRDYSWDQDEKEL